MKKLFTFLAVLVLSLSGVAQTAVTRTSSGVVQYTGLTIPAPLVTTSIRPATDDGAPLGDTTHNWSDLFIASGGVFNWANGNVVLTQSSGILTLGTGDFRITTAGTNSASAVTVAGTQTLINKTLTAPVLGTPLSITLTNGTGLPDGGLTLTDVTTNNVSTTKHGFAPKGDNNSAHFLDGTGAYSTPAGGGNVSNGGTPVANQLAIWSAATTVIGDSDLTFSGTRLTATDLTVTNFPTFSSGTATRVPFFSTAGLLADSSALTFNSGTGELSATSFTGAGTGLTGTASSLTAGAATNGLTAASSASGSGVIWQSNGADRSAVASNTLGTVVITTVNATTLNLAAALQLFSDPAPTTSAAGYLAFDNNAWASGRGAMQVYDGTANTYVVAALSSDTPTNGQVPTWNTGGTVTWETPSGGAALTNTFIGYGASSVLSGEAAFTYNAATNTATVGAISLGGGNEVSSIGPLVDSVDGTTPLNNIVETTAAGTAYTLTTSYAAIDFGTTDPVIVLPNAGTYTIQAWVQTTLVSATTTTQSVSFKMRRTNNTAADLGDISSAPLPVATIGSEIGPSCVMISTKYTTANTNDSLTIQGLLSASLGAGTCTITAAHITAIRAY